MEKYDTLAQLFLIGVLMGILLSSFIVLMALYHNNRIKHQLLYLLNKQKMKIQIQREEIEKQCLEISDKNAAISKLNEQLREINHLLESKVSKRTAVLESHNKKIVKYSFIVAHKLRAPLASILGLVNVIQMQKAEKTDEVLIEYLKTSAEALDKIIYQIQAVLSR